MFCSLGGIGSSRCACEFATLCSRERIANMTASSCVCDGTDAGSTRRRTASDCGCDVLGLPPTDILAVGLLFRAAVLFLRGGSGSLSTSTSSSSLLNGDSSSGGSSPCPRAAGAAFSLGGCDLIAGPWSCGFAGARGCSLAAPAGISAPVGLRALAGLINDSFRGACALGAAAHACIGASGAVVEVPPGVARGGGLGVISSLWLPPRRVRFGGGCRNRSTGFTLVDPERKRSPKLIQAVLAALALLVELAVLCPFAGRKPGTSSSDGGWDMLAQISRRCLGSLYY